MTITPSVDPALLRPEPRLLVTIVRIDKALVEELGRVALLPDLSFGQGDDHRRGEYAILDDHGRPLGDLRWRANQPGNQKGIAAGRGRGGKAVKNSVVDVSLKK